MAGMFSGEDHPSFDWSPKNIFDEFDVPDKREKYLQDLSGTGNKEREMAEEIRGLDEDEMTEILHQIPDKMDRDDYLQTYYGLK